LQVLLAAAAAAAVGHRCRPWPAQVTAETGRGWRKVGTIRAMRH
jgi:hypothetical protein